MQPISVPRVWQLVWVCGTKATAPLYLPELNGPHWHTQCHPIDLRSGSTQMCRQSVCSAPLCARGEMANSLPPCQVLCPMPCHTPSCGPCLGSCWSGRGQDPLFFTHPLTTATDHSCVLE